MSSIKGGRRNEREMRKKGKGRNERKDVELKGSTITFKLIKSPWEDILFPCTIITTLLLATGKSHPFIPRCLEAIVVHRGAVHYQIGI